MPRSAPLSERLADIADYHAARTETSGKKPGSYRPLAADALYLTRAEFDAALSGWPIHRADIFAQPESASVIDFGFTSARDFTPERAQAANSGPASGGGGTGMYEIAARHLQAVGRAGKKPILAAYTTGSRARIAAILGEALAPAPALADSWQEALGLAAKGRPVALVLPLETGFANAELEAPDRTGSARRPAGAAQAAQEIADAFLAELAALTPGDLVVHMEHGIGALRRTAIDPGRAMRRMIA